MLHLFKPSACPLRFASGTHLGLIVELFIISPCRHGLATSSQTVSVGHERKRATKGKPENPWRLLRRLIGESLRSMPFRQLWDCCRLPILKQSLPCKSK